MLTATQQSIRELKGLELAKLNHIERSDNDYYKVKSQSNNNKMERLNGEIRDREKVMRGLKNANTPILKGYQIYHNYIRGHEGLNGKTPSEACGVEIKGENKWITLIQNASQKNSSE